MLLEWLLSAIAQVIRSAGVEGGRVAITDVSTVNRMQSVESERSAKCRMVLYRRLSDIPARNCAYRPESRCLIDGRCTSGRQQCGRLANRLMCVMNSGYPVNAMPAGTVEGAPVENALMC